MSDLESYHLYQEALDFTEKFNEPIGFSDYSPTAQGDHLQIRQNNTILYLLIKLHQLLDIIETKNKTPENKDISELIDK